MFYFFLHLKTINLQKQMSTENPKIDAYNLVPTDYSKLSDEQLLDVYNKTFQKDKTLNYISNKYLKTNLTKGGKLNQSAAFFNRRMDWRKKYINKLNEHFTNRLHERMPIKQPPKINEFGIYKLFPDEMTDWGISEEQTSQ